MSAQTVAQSASALRNLTNTASTLRRVILENEPKVGSVDSFSSTHFRDQWSENRAGYNNILDASDAAAAKLAATIKYYISLQGDVNEPGAADDMIEEFGALNMKLQGLDFDQSADIAALKESFQLIGRDLAAAYKARDVAVRAELEAAQAEVATLSKQLKDINAKIKKEDEETARQATSRASSYLGGLLGGKSKTEDDADETVSEADKAKKAKAKKAAELTQSKAEAMDAAKKLLASGDKDSKEALRRDLQEQLEIAQAKLIKATSAARDGESIDLDALLQVDRDIQKGLDTQIEQLRTLPNLSEQLAKELANYLAAFENVKADPSTDNQRTLVNLHRKVALSCGPWRDIAVLLGDVYAKKQK
ncbi:hypothetical protein GY45DRAFT_1357631 [Cubamyces sp. BRFM 1775]|nr:hypothetical protein GY45DRAFT_1357631 [Cubamyces sp. BRFM 1775]